MGQMASPTLSHKSDNVSLRNDNLEVAALEYQTENKPRCSTCGKS